MHYIGSKAVLENRVSCFDSIFPKSALIVFGASMQPHMSDKELNLFTSIVSCAENYVEFGSGGSTFAACSLARNSVTSLDSSQEWLDKVASNCADARLRIRPTLVFVDIGPTREWGYPTTPNSKPLWANYHSTIWQRHRESSSAEVFLVDGRFRVACFMQILLQCRHDALIMVHDYRSRAHYHSMSEVAREIATAEDLSLFLPKKIRDSEKIHNILEAHSNNPA